METKSPNKLLYRHAQSGMTLVETVIALAILLIVASGIMTTAVISITTTEDQGNLGARTAEYAQDKIEQLKALEFCDSASDTTQFPVAAAGGTGLAVGGSTSTTAPVASYVDYLDANGNPLGGLVGGNPPAGWYYVRAWQVSTPGCAPPVGYCSPAPNPVWPVTPAGFCTIKQIVVATQVARNVATAGTGRLVSGNVMALKSYPY